MNLAPLLAELHKVWVQIQPYLTAVPGFTQAVMTNGNYRARTALIELAVLVLTLWLAKKVLTSKRVAGGAK